MIKKLLVLCAAAMAAMGALTATEMVNGIYGPFVPGSEVEVNLGLVGYTAKKLPSGVLERSIMIVCHSPSSMKEYLLPDTLVSGSLKPISVPAAFLHP